MDLAIPEFSGFDIFKALKEWYRLVVSDTRMPVIDGY
jgi:CheY-like chemotaxis protein